MSTERPRLGRPPSSSSAETRRRILRAAQEQFSYRGFDGTSNRVLAEEAGLTAGAIYHYFDSKLDIYTAVFEDVQAHMYERLTQAVEKESTLVHRIQALLEESHQLNKEDPVLARFLGTSRVDAARNPALADALRRIDPQRRRNLFEGMLDLGVETGEIDESSRDQVRAVLRAITTGLTDALSSDLTTHRAAIDGIMALVHGSLLRPIESHS